MATGVVQPVIKDRPGQVESAVAAEVRQLRRSIEERTGTGYSLQRQGEVMARSVSTYAAVTG